MFPEVMADPASLVLVAMLVAACSGVPGLLLRNGSAGQRLATLGALIAALLGLPVCIFLLLEQRTVTFTIDWNLPFDRCEIALDPLSCFFIIPIFLVFLCGSVYANGYWPATSHRSSEPGLTFFYGILAAAMVLVAVARNGVLFLIAWELMALAGYFLLITDHGEEEVRTAGTVYLVATHVGTAALIVLFSLLRLHGTSFLFPGVGGLHVATAPASVLFIAALIGFGSKAGLMPLHIWLPSAHANAPSHVSALLSGVMLKMGIYGLLRVLSMMTDRPLWWGGVLAVMGLVSALLGICLAASQRDIKRLLAYSSIENIGIITTGIGIALIGQATGNGRLAFLGMTGALLHVLYHSLFKPLLFLCAGSVIHAGGTREMDRMGGLARAMPWSAALTLCGAIAICGLPPFNGFVSEFFLYMGFFGEARAAVPAVVLGAPILAMVGGVAVISFVKLYGMTFLGHPRSEQASHGHEAPAAMLVPMTVLALLCLTGGLVPQLFLSLTTPLVTTLTPLAATLGDQPLQPVWFTIAGVTLLILAAVVYGVVRCRSAALPATTGPTWGCGYLAPTPRMQYTGTAFSEILTSLLDGIVRTRIARTAIKGYNPAPAKLSYMPEETILERLIQPLFRVAGIGFAFVRRLQHGQLHIYMVYFFVTLVVLMLWR
jgi:hydrogenase-4 component B